MDLNPITIYTNYNMILQEPIIIIIPVVKIIKEFPIIVVLLPWS